MILPCKRDWPWFSYGGSTPVLCTLTPGIEPSVRKVFVPPSLENISRMIADSCNGGPFNQICTSPAVKLWIDLEKVDVNSCNNHWLQQLGWGCESNGHECRVTTYSICCNEHLIISIVCAHWRGHFLDPGAAVQFGQNIQGTTSVVGDPAYHNCIWLCTYNMNATGLYRT